jgi:hypothetical protein
MLLNELVEMFDTHGGCISRLLCRVRWNLGAGIVESCVLERSQLCGGWRKCPRHVASRQSRNHGNLGVATPHIADHRL